MDSYLYGHYKDTLKQLKIEIKSYVDNYEKLSFSKRLEVENQIKMTERIDEILSDLSGKTGPKVSEYVREELQRGYYGTWYALEGAENIQLDFGMLPEKYIEQLVNRKVDGKNFSKRLYEHRDELAERVTTVLLNGAERGEGYAKVAKNIGELTEANYKQALRIARTEGGRTQSTAKQKAYQDAEKKGVDLQKRWMATLDKKTRHQHQELDGQTVDVDEQFDFNGNKADGPRLFGIAGLDIGCRCTTISVVNGVAPELRIDNITKETIEYTKYSDWYASKKVQNEIGKQKYTEYVSDLSKKYNTKDFGKLLEKMTDKEYEKLGIFDISNNEVEWIPKKKRGK